MTITERRNAIIECLKNDGSIKSSDIIVKFGVSDVTARNDLSALETLGMLKRVHGGAILTTESAHTLSQQDKMLQHKEEKIRIAKAIDHIIKDRTSLFISNGTTNVYVSRELVKKNNLMVMTNCWKIVEEFRDNRSDNVLFFGGLYNYIEDSAYGNDTLAMMDHYSPEVAIISVDGVSGASGVTIYNVQEVNVYKKMIQRANKVILVADSSKIGNSGLAKVCNVDDIDLIITTADLSSPELEIIKKRGVGVIQV